MSNEQEAPQHIEADALTYLGKGKDHVVFTYQAPGSSEPNMCVKIKQDLKAQTNKTEMTVIKNQKEFYKQLNNKWFEFVRSFDMKAIFPDLQKDTRLPISAVDTDKVDKMIKDKGLQVSKEFDILVSSNLFHESKDFGHKSFFIETKPKSLMRFSFSHAEVDMVLPGIRKQRNFWDVYNSKIKNKQFTRRSLYYNIEEPTTDNYLFYNTEVFKKTIQEYGGTKYFDYKRYSDDRTDFKKFKPEEIHEYFGMRDQAFTFMLQRAFFRKYEVFGHKHSVYGIFRCFQNLFPYPVSIFKSHLDKIANFKYKEDVMERIFEKARQLVLTNKRAHIEPLEFLESEKLLEAFVFMLISQVISDASLIVHVVQFNSAKDAEAFVQRTQGYFVERFCTKWVAFRFNLIDTEMKRFKKIFTYFSKERKYMEKLFNINK